MARAFAFAVAFAFKNKAALLTSAFGLSCFHLSRLDLQSVTKCLLAASLAYVQQLLARSCCKQQQQNIYRKTRQSSSDDDNDDTVDAGLRQKKNKELVRYLLYISCSSLGIHKTLFLCQCRLSWCLCCRFCFAANTLTDDEATVRPTAKQTKKP